MDSSVNWAKAKSAYDAGDISAAIQFLRAGIEIDRTSPELHNNLGHLLRRTGNTPAAVDSFREALRLRPGYLGAHSNLVYAMLFDPRTDGQGAFNERSAWAERQAGSIKPLNIGHRHHDRLRIGYVSPNFRNQAVSFFVEPIVGAHDRKSVEVYCYCDTRKMDFVTDRIRARCEHWRDISGQADDAVANQIVADEIDVLVDLTGHLAQNRLLVFARKPAPVQVSYIGDQATTGLRSMNWRITDSIVDPPGAERYHTERLYRLPGAFFVYQPHGEAPGISALPAIKHGLVHFGSFNFTAKLNAGVIAAWCEILRRLPRSRLTVLLYDIKAGRDYIGGLVARDVADRIEFIGRQSLPDYLQAINRVDIALDSFPFNGHTTTCDCLWMGAPVVTLAGDAYWKRMSASVLSAIGTPELIASSPERYVDIAVELAGDIDRLGVLRGQLRDRMRAVTGAPEFTRQLEEAFWKMLPRPW